MESNKDLADMPLTELREFSRLIDEDVFAVLSLSGSMAARNHAGGTAPSQVRAAADAARQRLASSTRPTAGR